MSASSKTNREYKQRPLVDLMVSIVIPSVILMKFSGAEDLGATNALIVALAFPISWGCFELISYKKFNYIALLGLISVLLTGGIGLLELDNKWLAIKEAAIPGLIGVGVLISTYTRYPLIRTIVMNKAVINVDKVTGHLKEKGNVDLFNKQLRNANFFFAGTFVFSTIMNYILAKWIVVSPSGSSAFNEELGRLTFLSYPMIAIPSMIMMIGIMYYLWRTVTRLTGLTLEEVLVTKAD